MPGKSKSSWGRLANKVIAVQNSRRLRKFDDDNSADEDDQTGTLLTEGSSLQYVNT